MSAQLDYQTISRIFQIFESENPEPKGELNYVNHYTLLVAVALSAQATDASVNLATKTLFTKVTTPEAMIELGEERLIDYIRSIGLYKTKAKNIIGCAEILVRDYDGIVPDSRAALASLPGVGRKTANVVLNIAFGHPAQAVDTHIFRFANRSGVAIGRDVEKVERAIEDHIPARYQKRAHHWMILHGRYICRARKPNCNICLIKEFCNFEEKPDE